MQLNEAAADTQIWAENYDRKLDDVFAIQSEIALAIADQLKLYRQPTPAGARPADDPWELLCPGRFI